MHTRGRIEKGSEDGGKDLVMMVEGGFPEVILSGYDCLSGAVFSPDGRFFLVQTGKGLLLGHSQLWRTVPILTLRAGEKFVGTPVWIREESVLFGASGGEPKRHRLFLAKVPAWEKALASGYEGERMTLFTADHGASLMSWDHSQANMPEAAHVALIHRLPNAMIAEVVVLPGPEGSQKPAKVVALDARVEYCKPRIAFVAGGSLVMRLNLPLKNEHDNEPCDAEFLEQWASAGAERGSSPVALPARHGLWLLESLQNVQIKPIHVIPELEHGTYDVYSGSYANRHGVPEGFVLDSFRRTAVVTARPHIDRDADPTRSYTDKLWYVTFVQGDGSTQALAKPVSTEKSGKGCHVPVCVSQGKLVYHCRSPTERGDLWATTISGDCEAACRLTYTMPRSLRQKLLVPDEVDIPGPAGYIHALLYKPTGEAKCQPIVWIHGGPMAQYSWDYNPLPNWLASLGYFVLVPNFRGSTGCGVGYMDKVFAEGCGRDDLSDCVACAKYLLNDVDLEESEPRLDTTRGVGVGGHSWGGYLTLMCMLESRKTRRDAEPQSIFSCGVASAGITDWFVQQRYTEVRYFDYSLMGGWVYERDVAERARDASPITNVSDELRAPLLVLHGDQDIDCPFSQIPPFVEAARRSVNPGASVEYHAYEGEGHGISGTAAQADILQRMSTFFRINLKPWDFTDNPHGDLTAY